MTETKLLHLWLHLAAITFSSPLKRGVLKKQNLKAHSARGHVMEVKKNPLSRRFFLRAYVSDSSLTAPTPIYMKRSIIA